MQHLLNAAKVGKDMVDRRDFMKRIFGDRYQAHVAQGKTIIRAVKKRDGSTTLIAALEICRDCVRDGHGDSVNVIIAAAVDLIEEGD